MTNTLALSRVFLVGLLVFTNVAIKQSLADFSCFKICGCNGILGWASRSCDEGPSGCAVTDCAYHRYLTCNGFDPDDNHTDDCNGGLEFYCAEECD